MTRFAFLAFGIALLGTGLLALIPMPGKYGNPAICDMDIMYGVILIAIGLIIPLLRRVFP